MKYKLLAVCFISILICTKTYGQQWSGSSNTSGTISRSGDVAIGNLSSRQYLKISSSQWPEIRFQSPSSNEKIRTGMAHIASSTYDIDEGDFYVFTSTVSQMPLIVRKGGNVMLNGKGGSTGIGTSSPTAKLHTKTDVSGSHDTNNAAIFESTGGHGIVTIRSKGSGNFAALYGSLGTDIVGAIDFRHTTGDFSFWTNDLGGTSWRQRMIIKNNTGFIGIGTTDPTNSKLHISKSNTEPYPNEQIRLQSVGGSAPSTWRFDVIADNGMFSIVDNSIGRRLNIDALGNIGIGTEHPDAKLTVKGDIHTQEVTVDLQGAIAPDFVFEEDYDLKTLEETEEYIQANKHLPEIPSASEMKENGFELKKMNLRLLQKVEELTLHLIEQNKEIKTLKEKVAKLEWQK